MRAAFSILCLAACALLGDAQQAPKTPAPAGGPRLTLEQAGSRTGSDFVPAYEGRLVTVRGQVSTKPIAALDSYCVPIQDEAEYGLLLQGQLGQFANLEPGDWIEAEGIIGRRAGLPVLHPVQITRSGHSQPPAAKDLRLDALASFRYLGLLVASEGRVLSSGENGGGELLTLADRDSRIVVFLAKQRRDAGRELAGYRAGDRVRVTGIATQYCPLPPYDRAYQVLLASSGGVILLDKAWPVPPSLLLLAVLLIVLLVALWSLRERHLARQAATMQALNSLGEQVIGTTSPAELSRKLMTSLSELLQASGVAILVYNRQTQKLESFHGEGTARQYKDAQPLAAPIVEPAFVAYRNRVLLSVPDTRRSPLFGRVRPQNPPRSALFVPMFAQGELAGVLEIEHSEKPRYFTQNEQTAIQHLANQAAAALKLQEQQSVREQLFRSEKLSVAGQLMSSIANELRAPLDSILDVVDVARESEGTEQYCTAIAAEARRASDIVRRLLSFSKSEDAEASAMDLNSLVSDAIAFREAEFRSQGVTIRRRLAREPLVVLGSRGQLEQVLLNLLAHAAQTLDTVVPRYIDVVTTLLARRATVEISWATSGEGAVMDASSADACGGLGLDVCRGIVHSHGGEVRFAQPAAGVARFEIELPIAEIRDLEPQEGARVRTARRQLTALVVEPEATSQKQLVAAFTKFGHRVVPVASAEEGADLVARLRFDVTVCTSRLPGLSWSDFRDRVRASVSAFVLLTDSYDASMARVLQSGDVLMLKKPIEEAELQKICDALSESEARLLEAR